MRVLVDACVLYPTVMREVVLGCAEAALFEAKWSARIVEEWTRAAARGGAEMAAQAQAEAAGLAVRFPGAEVPAHAGLERRLWLPDPADVHVLAAAVACGADIVLTLNAKDFPGQILAEEGLSRADPDGFLLGLWKAEPQPVAAVAKRVLGTARVLSGEDWTMRALLKKARLPRLGKALAVD